MYKTVCTRCQNPAAGKVSLSMALRILCCLSVAQSLCCVSHRLILLLHYYFGWSKSKNDIEVNRAGQMFCLGHIYPSKSQSQSCFCPADLKLVSKTAGKMLKLAWNEGRWRHFKGEKTNSFHVSIAELHDNQLTPMGEKKRSLAPLYSYLSTHQFPLHDQIHGFYI